MSKLSPKQQRFVEEYPLDLNGLQAAIRAGYSPKTAGAQASRLLKNVNVKAAINKAMVERSERVKIDADWVLKRLTKEAEADISDLYDDDGNIKTVKEWPLIWRQGLISGLEVESMRLKPGKVTKIKISDRIKRIELIGRHVSVQAFLINSSMPATDEGLKPNEVDKMIADAEKRAAQGANKTCH